MVKRDVMLDPTRIFPTEWPRKSSSIEVANAKSLGDINPNGIILQALGSDRFGVIGGQHRIGRAMELAPGGKLNGVEVVGLGEQVFGGVWAARTDFDIRQQQLNIRIILRK